VTQVEPPDASHPVDKPARESKNPKSLEGTLCYVVMPFSKTTKRHTKKYWTDHYGEMRDSHLLGSDVKVEPGRQQVIIDTAG
jgi:hypothetical protein